MTVLRVPAARLLGAVVANAAASPMPPHRLAGYRVLQQHLPLTDGERWVVGSIMALPSASESHWARLRAIECRLERDQ